MMYTMMTWSVENVLKGSKRMNNLCMTKKKLALNLLSPVILSSTITYNSILEKCCSKIMLLSWHERMGTKDGQVHSDISFSLLQVSYVIINATYLQTYSPLSCPLRAVFACFKSNLPLLQIGFALLNQVIG